MSSLDFIASDQDADQLKTAYVRGRKLHGTTIRLPQGYHGSVVEKGETKREIPRSDALDNDVDVEELAEAIEVAPLSSKASFTDFVIWGHESTAEAGADPYLRSIEEWVSFSEKVCAHVYRLFDMLALLSTITVTCTSLSRGSVNMMRSKLVSGGGSARHYACGWASRSLGAG